MKKCVIIAGINGAGKTTYYRSLDGEIADMKRQELAGDMARKNIFGFIENGVNYCQETALCGPEIIEEIQKAKKFEYYVEMHYIFLESCELAIKRVHDRVTKGGHHVEDELVVKRYQESIDNLISICVNIDRLLLFDNSDTLIKLAEIAEGSCIIYENMYSLIIDKIKQKKGIV